MFETTTSQRGGFITGSHAYGTPTPESDIDLVVLVEPEVHDLLLLACSDEAAYPICYGNLNLIPVTSVERYDAWEACTKYPKSIGPVTRDEAVAEFNRRGITGYKPKQNELHEHPDLLKKLAVAVVAACGTELKPEVK